jgi:hypothetical protein
LVSRARRRWPPPSPVGDGAQLSLHVMKSMNQTAPSANSRMTSASPISPTILMAAPTPRQNECRGTAVPPVHCYLDNGHRIRARCWWQVPARRGSAGRGAYIAPAAGITSRLSANVRHAMLKTPRPEIPPGPFCPSPVACGQPALRDVPLPELLVPKILWFLSHLEGRSQG